MENRQGVCGLSRAWFYLTLWNGTPPDFTEEFDVNIHERDVFDAAVRTESTADAIIITGSSFAADIQSREEADVDVITSTGVIWYVG